MLAGWEWICILFTLIIAAVVVVSLFDYLKRVGAAKVSPVGQYTPKSTLYRGTVGEALYVKCSHCGAFIPEVSNFCSTCGVKRAYSR